MCNSWIQKHQVIKLNTDIKIQTLHWTKMKKRNEIWGSFSFFWYFSNLLGPKTLDKSTERNNKEAQPWRPDEKTEGQILFHLLQLIAVNLLCQVAVKPFLSPPPSYKTLPFCSVPVCTDFNGAQRRLELWQRTRQRGSEMELEGRMKQTDRWVGDRGEARCTDYWEGQVGRHVPGKTGRGERGENERKEGWKWAW